MLIYLNLTLGPSTKKWIEWDWGICGLYYKLPQRLKKIRFRFCHIGQSFFSFDGNGKTQPTVLCVLWSRFSRSRLSLWDPAQRILKLYLEIRGDNQLSLFNSGFLFDSVCVPVKKGNFVHHLTLVLHKMIRSCATIFNHHGQTMKMESWEDY